MGSSNELWEKGLELPERVGRGSNLEGWVLAATCVRELIAQCRWLRDFRKGCALGCCSKGSGCQGICYPEYKAALSWAGGRGFALRMPPAPAATSRVWGSWRGGSKDSIWSSPFVNALWTIMSMLWVSTLPFLQNYPSSPVSGLKSDGGWLWELQKGQNLI